MSQASPWLLFAGPPFGPAFWNDVVPRLTGATTPDLLPPDRGTLADVRRHLTALPGWDDSIVVAHGSAVPAIVAAALDRPPAGVILSNGPVRALDPATQALRTSLRTSAIPLLPALWLPLLRSSFALRRTVANPYVMDRDTVALLCGGLVADGRRRAAVRAYLRSLSAPLPDPSGLRCPTGVVWGDADALNPASEADWFEATIARPVRIDVQGGRFAHPVERPWAFADALTVIAASWAAHGNPGHERRA